MKRHKEFSEWGEHVDSFQIKMKDFSPLKILLNLSSYFNNKIFKISLYIFLLDFQSIQILKYSKKFSKSQLRWRFQINSPTEILEYNTTLGPNDYVRTLKHGS